MKNIYFKTLSYFKNTILNSILKIKWHTYKKSFKNFLQDDFSDAFLSLTRINCLLLFLIIPSHQVSKDNVKRSQSYWSQTSLTLSTLHSMVNQDSCYEKSLNFLGCMHALSSLLTLASDQEIHLLFPSSKINQGISYLSDINIMSTPEKRFQDISEVLNDFKLSMSDKLAKWKKLYHQTQKNKIDFEQILTETIERYEATSKSLLSKSLLTYLLRGTLKRFHTKRLIAQAINSYLAITESPHAHIIPLSLIKDHSQVSHEEFSGVGIILFQLQKHLIIKRVLDGSPAFQVGLKPGDIISKVQNEDVSQIHFSEVSQVIDNVPAKTVHLEILRQGTKQHFAVNKQVIKVDNVRTEYIKDNDKKYALIRISSFYKLNTCADVAKSIDEIQQDSQVTGLIIDLRGNPGGLIEEALCTADLFLPKDRLLLEIRPFNQLQPSEFHFSVFPQLTDLPLFVFINAGTASSSEIVAGILGDHNRGILIGERSYGKGTLLHGSLFQYPQYPNLIHYKKFAQFFFPSRRSNHIVGILPHYNVQFEDKSLTPFREEDLFTYQLLPFQKDDPQEHLPHSPVYPYQSALKDYQDCLDGLKSTQKLHYNQQTEDAFVKTILRCITSPDHQMAAS